MNRLNQIYKQTNIYPQHCGVDTGYSFSDEQVQWTCEPKPSESPTLMTKLRTEKDSETGLSYLGARYYEPEMLNIWLSVDPMADKYPSLSPYNYCAWNPIKLVDPNGREIDMNPYLIFNGDYKTLQIWDDNNTPDDYTDDFFIGEYNASNNVSKKDNPKGKWEDGVYPMLDKKSPHKHYEADGKTPKKENGKNNLEDSKGGPYGEYGIFRAEPFMQDDGKTTEGRGVHAGRNVDGVTVLTSFTNGCIRTTQEGVEAIINAISTYGPLTKIIVQNNRESTRINVANFIIPGKNPIELKNVEITTHRYHP